MLVYHFVDAKYGLDNVRQRRLKIATINELNDPFELMSPILPNPELRRDFANTKAEIAKRHGLLCFSKHWSNPVQWSHYANRHRGICLGFEIADNLLMPVHYTPKRTTLDLQALSGTGPAAYEEMKKLLCTKYSHWRYENEIRIFVRLEEMDTTLGLYFASFSEQLALRSVIVGHRSAVTRAELNDALGDLGPTVSVWKARLAFKSFKVVRQKMEALWS